MISRLKALLICLAISIHFSANSYAEEPKLTFSERIALKLEVLKSENVAIIRDALLLGVKYGNQAKEDEGNGDDLAHERAAYEWGYEVGDPKIVKMIRFFWEGVQLGVFGFGDYQENTNGKGAQWSMLESMVGGNGKEYTVDQAYVNDIFHDVSIATDGATIAQSGGRSDFGHYAESALNQ